MTTIQDDQLDLHAERVKGKVVLITGAASGIGRETAFRYVKHGASVVLGDVNEVDLKAVIGEIRRRGGEAAGQHCDVTSWDQQLALFELAIKKFGAVDIVVANAGVNEIGSFYDVNLVDGRPAKPQVKTLDINLTGTIYSTHLALHYLDVNRSSNNSLKGLVMIGSMASWQTNHKGPIYSAAKHAVLGLARAMHPPLAEKNIRIAIIHPFFAETSLLSLENKLVTIGIPLLPLERVAGTILFATTDPSPKSNGSVWLMPDGGPTFRMEKEVLRAGVYQTINERTRAYKGPLSHIQIAADLWDIVWKRMLLGVAPVVAGSILYGKL